MKKLITSILISTTLTGAALASSANQVTRSMKVDQGVATSNEYLTCYTHYTLNKDAKLLNRGSLGTWGHSLQGFQVKSNNSRVIDTDGTETVGNLKDMQQGITEEVTLKTKGIFGKKYKLEMTPVKFNKNGPSEVEVSFAGETINMKKDGKIALHNFYTNIKSNRGRIELECSFQEPVGL